MKYTGVIFDLDGVLCHTDKYHYQAWKRLADELGVYFDEEINNRLRGVSRMDSLAIILERYTGAPLDEAQKQALAEKKNALYQRLLRQMSPADLSCEVYDTLCALREAGTGLAIGSSSRNAPLILRQIGLDGYFDAVSDGNGLVHSKPHPEVFLKAAGMLGLPPASCLVVEDAEAGVQASTAAGMHSAVVGDAARMGLGTYRPKSLAGLVEIVNG